MGVAISPFNGKHNKIRVVPATTVATETAFMRDWIQNGVCLFPFVLLQIEDNGKVIDSNGYTSL